MSDGITAEDGSAQFGRLEFYSAGGWGTVCNLQNLDFGADPEPLVPFTDASAVIACRQLGLPDQLGNDRAGRWGRRCVLPVQNTISKPPETVTAYTVLVTHHALRAVFDATVPRLLSWFFRRLWSSCNTVLRVPSRRMYTVHSTRPYLDVNANNNSMTQLWCRGDVWVAF